MLSYGHLVYDFGTVKNWGTEKKEPNCPTTESGTETGTVPSLVHTATLALSVHTQVIDCATIKTRRHC